MDALVGVDIGTTTVKAVAFDASGAERGAAERGRELREPAPGEAVQDPAVSAESRAFSVGPDLRLLLLEDDTRLLTEAGNRLVH